MATEGMSNEEIAAARRIEQLSQHAALLAQVEMLSVPTTIKVLKLQLPDIIVLVDAHSATVKIPAFQFLRDANDVPLPLPNRKVQAVNREKGGYHGYPNLNINGAWSVLSWWRTPMKLDASDPNETPFAPIDIVDDAVKLDLVAKWLKEWADESYG